MISSYQVKIMNMTNNSNNSSFLSVFQILDKKSFHNPIHHIDQLIVDLIVRMSANIGATAVWPDWAFPACLRAACSAKHGNWC